MVMVFDEYQFTFDEYGMIKNALDTYRQYGIDYIGGISVEKLKNEFMYSAKETQASGKDIWTTGIRIKLSNYDTKVLKKALKFTIKRYDGTLKSESDEIAKYKAEIAQNKAELSEIQKDYSGGKRYLQRMKNLLTSKLSTPKSTARAPKATKLPSNATLNRMAKF